jgi:hypothetical protein
VQYLVYSYARHYIIGLAAGIYEYIPVKLEALNNVI